MTAIALLAQLADLLAWYAATSRGAVEGNPLMSGAPLLVVIKLFAIVAVISLAQTFPRKYWWMRNAALVVATFFGLSGAISGVLA